MEIRKPAKEMTAMELIELALDLPEDEQASFIAGAAQPTHVRLHALRMLEHARQQNEWPSLRESPQPTLGQPRNASRA